MLARVSAYSLSFYFPINARNVETHFFSMIEMSIYCALNITQYSCIIYIYPSDREIIADDVAFVDLYFPWYQER